MGYKSGPDPDRWKGAGCGLALFMIPFYALKVAWLALVGRR